MKHKNKRKAHEAMLRMSDMKSVVDEFGLNPTNKTMLSVVDRVRTSQITDEEISYLATTLGRSGVVLATQECQPAADLVSTGAPTSLSTLLGPLYLRSMGYTVPKLGVPGRPAGGVDTLAQLPGYRVKLSNDEVRACIDRCGYAHFLSNQDHAPLDARLFKFRQRTSSQNIPELTIASLLSKKIATGLKRVGLDIRVAPHGNFGDTWEEAHQNAQCFRRVASILGIDSVCFLTDARFPYQPFVGRGESLVALKETFSGSQEYSLVHHATMCFAMASAVAVDDHYTVDLRSGMAVAEKHFYDNLQAQGSSRDAFDEYVEKTQSGHRFHFTAKNRGFVSIRIESLRELVLRFQKVCTKDGTTFPDGMGIVLRKRPGEFVQPGDLLATIRVSDKEWQSVERQLSNVLVISNTLELGMGFERVTNG